jgi:hypothetical protein
MRTLGHRLQSNGGIIKTYEHAHVHSSLTYYRNEFENMLLKYVNWQLYDLIHNVLPGQI